MKNLLILWSLPEKNKDYEKYETIIEVWKRYFKSINSPIDTKDFKWNNSERFNRAIKSVENSDFIIWEMSLPSTGQWIEIWIAYSLQIPIIILAKQWSKISGLIKWDSYVKEIIFYSDLVELKKNLSEYFINK